MCHCAVPATLNRSKPHFDRNQLTMSTQPLRGTKAPDKACQFLRTVIFRVLRIIRSPTKRVDGCSLNLELPSELDFCSKLLSQPRPLLVHPPPPLASFSFVGLRHRGGAVAAMDFGGQSFPNRDIDGGGSHWNGKREASFGILLPRSPRYTAV